MTKTTDRKKGKKVSRRFKSAALGAVTTGLLGPALRRKGFMQTEIVAKWRQIVGDELAGMTVPLSLKFPRGKRLDATLEVRCVSAFAPLLQHRAPMVIDAVNRYFGYGAVARLVVKQGPLPRRSPRAPHRSRRLLPAQQSQLDRLIPDVGSAEKFADRDGLRAALKRLGTSVLAENGDK